MTGEMNLALVLPLPSLAASVTPSTSQEESNHIAALPIPSTSMEPSSSNTSLIGDQHKLRSPAEHGEEEEEGEKGMGVEMECRRESTSSNDSFYSAASEEETVENQLYLAARELVQKKGVKCRKNR